ncbi:MAG: hypothetical protein K2Y22_04930 [Candidatus Obscuribacterales bacterium]|nr:hypothetical protein [Candidatus Obscuribacterales bacterium]
MLYEVIREIVSRIAQDKVLMGLIVILVLGSFWGGMQVKHGSEGGYDREVAVPVQAEKPVEHPAAEGPKLDGSLACDFVKWWLTSAMDYSSSGAQQAKSKAFGWMTPEAQEAFKTAFWSPDIAAGIADGRIKAQYHLADVQTVAVNPDGSIVVCANGTFVYQAGGQPTSQQMQTDYLVRKDPSGLRIAGLYNRVAPVVSSSTY